MKEDTLFVDRCARPERRRGGVSATLLTAALRSHSDHATPWVSSGDHPARAFSTRFGFNPDDERTGLGELRLRAEP